MGWGSGSHLDGVAWACRWNPAPSAAPRARCGRRTGVSLVVCAPWSRDAALGSVGRAVVARPSGPWPPRPRGGSGEGAVRRLGTRRELLRRTVGPAFDRSRPGACAVMTAVARLRRRRRGSPSCRRRGHQWSCAGNGRPESSRPDAPDQDAGAGGPGRLAISEPYLPHQPPPSPHETITSSIIPSDHSDTSK
jgi:hypothetical protein